LADPDKLEALIYSDTAPPLDLDKAWFGIHFLLCNNLISDDLPESWAIMGGNEMPSPDLGYGPPRYLRPDEVTAVALALSNIPSERLRSRFDAAALTEANVYPNIWDDGPEAAAYLIQNYNKLVQLYAEATKAGHAMLLWIT
jgi:Domain of unknown function (DUF1877)